MTRVTFAGSLFAAMVVSQIACADDRPNIVFLYTDDQAPTAVGYLGHPNLKTPNIDRIFREGAHLSNSFVTTPVCSPARAGLMTSRYGSELGITDWISPQREPELGLDPETTTWAELLADAGYTNGLIGKWHLGTADRFHPTKTGYHHFTGFRGGGNRPRDPQLERDGTVEKFSGFLPDILTDHAIEFVQRNQSGPFVLSLHFRAPHAPWLPVADDDWAPYEHLDPEIPDPDYPKLDVALVKKRTREYLASVASVDRNVGRLLDTLKELEIADNTAVIFTSDHGYNLGHHGVWYKGNAQWQLTELPEQRWPYIGPKQRPNLFDQSLRVPTAIRWPAVVAPGTVINKTVTNLDWFPTLLEIAGVELPAELTVRGRSFAALLNDKQPSIPWNNDLYAEYSMKHGAQTDMRAYRTPNWKLMIDFKNEGRAELYDLKRDPGETTNLIESENSRIAEVRNELRERLRQELVEIGDPLSARLN